jgi:hypothetical protein
MGLIYLLMLWVPNIIWTKNQPEGYTPAGENKILLVFERVGQVLCTATALCFSDTNPHGWEPWLAWLFASALLMAVYELYWLRYFRNGCTLTDFYRPFAGVPLPGATLPIAAFFLLGVYGKLIWLIVAALILGIGHIGIHYEHLRKL